MSDRETLKWLWHKADRQHISIYFLIGIDIAVSILGVAFALLVRQLIDAAVSARPFIIYAVLMILTVIIQYALHALKLYLDEKTNIRLSNRLRSDMIHNLVYADYAKTMNHHTGEWMNHLFSDVRIAAGGLVGILPDTAGMIARLIFACGALFILEPLFFAVYFTAGVVLIIGVSLLRKIVKALHRDVQKKEDTLHSFLQELLENILIIKSFNAYDHMESRTDSLQNDYLESRLKRRKVSVMANTSFSLIFRLGYVFALIYGGYGLFAGTTSYGSLMAILQLVSQIQAPVARLSGVFTRVYEMIASCERIRSTENMGRSIQYTETADFSQIVFDQVSFHYDREQVLENVSFTVNKGDKAALTGISGGGKSTLFLLMMKMLEPDSGAVSFINQEGIKTDVPVGQLFAYVPQGNALFSGTIADNITFGKPYDEEKMEKALSLASAVQFVSALPEGIHTELRESGSGLSEGQIQRIAIARALYSEAPVLLLDEATSALDEKTEAELLENLSLLENRTILIVTHRKAALSICDKIYSLENGILSELNHLPEAV